MAWGILWLPVGCESARKSPVPQSSVASGSVVVGADLGHVWQVSQAELRHRGFMLDIVDVRDGEIETFPRTSSGWLEFWGHDVVTPQARAESSLRTIRRTVRLGLKPLSHGQCQLTCRVLVEQFCAGPRRVLGVLRAEYVLGSSGWQSLGNSDDNRPEHWINLGRDTALETAILSSIAETLGT